MTPTHKKLKVWGITLDGRTRSIVAAHTQKQAAELLKTSLHFLRGYGAETGNAEEIRVATNEPFTVINRGRS